MAVTELTLWNQALSALGTGSSVQSANENSVEARNCGIWYETVRDAIFAAAPWPCLTAFSRLALLVERDDDEDWVVTDPPPGRLYAFGLPSQFIRPRHLASFGQFELSTVDGTKCLACDEENPILCYTKRIDDPSSWDIGLQQAVVFGLAAHIAKASTGNDSDLQNMFTLANEKIMIARANNANSSQVQHEAIPDWLAARGQSLSMPTTRYFYPAANFTVMGTNNLG